MIAMLSGSELSALPVVGSVLLVPNELAELPDVLPPLIASLGVGVVMLLSFAP